MKSSLILIFALLPGMAFALEHYSSQEAELMDALQNSKGDALVGIAMKFAERKKAGTLSPQAETQLDEFFSPSDPKAKPANVDIRAGVIMYYGQVIGLLDEPRFKKIMRAYETEKDPYLHHLLFHALAEVKDIELRTPEVSPLQAQRRVIEFLNCETRLARFYRKAQ